MCPPPPCFHVQDKLVEYDADSPLLCNVCQTTIRGTGAGGIAPNTNTCTVLSRSHDVSSYSRRTGHSSDDDTLGREPHVRTCLVKAAESTRRPRILLLRRHCKNRLQNAYARIFHLKCKRHDYGTYRNEMILITRHMGHPILWCTVWKTNIRCPRRQWQWANLRSVTITYASVRMRAGTAVGNAHSSVIIDNGVPVYFAFDWKCERE
jgi:hypothetical protein